jgi:hypothetical protein
MLMDDIYKSPLTFGELFWMLAMVANKQPIPNPIYMRYLRMTTAERREVLGPKFADLEPKKTKRVKMPCFNIPRKPLSLSVL